MAKVYVGLGSNIEPEQHLQTGVAELRRRFGELSLSPTYESASVGFDGDDFLNLVAGFQSTLSPSEIVEELEAIHTLAGRVRAEEKFLSRTLDIDLLMVDDLVLKGPPLRLPRKDVLECAFVLKPMTDLAPDMVHPETGKTLAWHWEEFDQASQPLCPYTLDFPPSGGVC